jgi:hypothetical protein
MLRWLVVMLCSFGLRWQLVAGAMLFSLMLRWQLVATGDVSWLDVELAVVRWW